MTTYLATLRGKYAAGAAFLLATNAFSLLIPWFMKLAVEGLQHPGTTRITPTACAAVIALLAVVHCIARIFSRTFVLNAARVVEYRLREDLFRRLMILDLPFFAASRTGDILSRFSNDLTNVRMLTGFGIMSAMNTVILYAAAVTMMVRIHPTLTFWSILPFPLMVLIVKQVSQRMFHRSLDAQRELAGLSSLAEESVSAVRLIKSYCRERHFLDSFHAISRTYLDYSLSMARYRGLVLPVMASATGAGTLVVLFLGGRLVVSGAISLGDFVAFSGYLALLVWPTAVLGWILTLAQRGAASMSRLAEILQARPVIEDREGAVRLDRVGQGLEFRNLSFSFGDTRTLSAISFAIHAGERVGITGEVGSGKSTLLRLIPRLLPAGDGTIFIDGRDINTMDMASLRGRIGYVPQETFLFSRSIRENIAYGNAGAVDADILDAASRAGLLEDVEKFQEGLETLVGEKGVALSGGQKQRLAIARALVSRPDVLLLDDPLASVDAGREEEILGRLDEFCAGRTVLVVSQRLSVFRGCRRIIVLHKGRIAEMGTPEELIGRGGIFAEMHRIQRLREEFRD